MMESPFKKNDFLIANQLKAVQEKVEKGLMNSQMYIKQKQQRVKE